MDTPERNQIAAPVSRIEESPFSNFANSLSPINATKSTHISQTFTSLSFTSPPSVFTSPHVSLLKDSRTLRRHQVAVLSKPKLSSNIENKNCGTEQVPGGEEAADKEASVKRHSDDSKCTTAELPRGMKYDSGSPDCEVATSTSIEEKTEPEMSGAIVPYIQEPSVASFGTELNSHETNNDNDEAACDWQSLISAPTDLFVFDSPNDGGTLKGTFQKSIREETSVFTSLLSRFPPDQMSEQQNSCYVGSVMYNEVHENLGQSTQFSEVNGLGQMDLPPESLEISSINDYISGGSVEHSGNESIYNLHRGQRRRCLDFEMPRPRKSLNVAQFSGSSSSIIEENAVSDNMQFSTPVRVSSRCTPSGIGLHLNALAAASNNCRVLNQESSPKSQETPVKFLASVSSEKDASPVENELQVVEDSSQGSRHTVTEEFNTSSLKKKRRKFEDVGDNEGCKRCNCKKSKCLKLYCECFAAGIYCVDSCSCQECFNKPIHEETVLATRKQIESRNPLAFAPKVIKAVDSTQEIGEDSTRTPASARHKRGCNCKKSSCLKKYCECYQGGVGCSISCRCEGCKNAFGRKDGHTLLGAEAEIEEARAPEKHITDISSDLPAFSNNDEDQNSEFSLPKTPMRLFRPSILSASSKGKPPRSSFATIGCSSYLLPVDGLAKSTFLRSQPKTEKLQIVSEEEIPTVLQNSSPVKTLSPNSKRISPPHHENGSALGLRSSRKLILQSIPSFPSLAPRPEYES